MFNINPYQPYQYQPQLNTMPQTMYGQRQEVIRVNGENGARALNLAPNSSALVLDETAPIVWLCQTDGAGYKTVTAYSITPYQQQTAPDLNSLEARIKRLEDMIHDKPDFSSTGKTSKQRTGTNPADSNGN